MIQRCYNLVLSTNSKCYYLATAFKNSKIQNLQYFVDFQKCKKIILINLQKKLIISIITIKDLVALDFEFHIEISS